MSYHGCVLEKHSEQVHAIDQVRHSSGQVSYDFCPFSSKELLARLFFMYAMLQSLWLQFCQHLSLTHSSKTTLSPRTSSSTLIGPVKDWSMAHGEEALARVPFSFPQTTTPLVSASLAIMHKICKYLQGVLSAIGVVLPLGSLVLLFFFHIIFYLFILYFSLLPFLIFHPLYLLFFLFL